MRILNILGVAAIVIVLVAWPVIALANDAIDSEEIASGRDGYRPSDTPHSLPWLAIFLGMLSIVVILAPAFKNARRTHLD